jgi:flagellar protein FliS
MYPNAKSAYMDASVTTASPERLLVMLYDRLVLDVQRGLNAQQGGDDQEAGRQLMHAQDIVHFLRSSLDVDAWDGGEKLAALYDWIHAQLIKANIGHDSAITEHCLSLVTDLANTWREAAMATAAQSA